MLEQSDVTDGDPYCYLPLLIRKRVGLFVDFFSKVLRNKDGNDDGITLWCFDFQKKHDLFFDFTFKEKLSLQIFFQIVSVVNFFFINE